MPLALRIFFVSLIVGVLSGYGAFKVALYLALRFIEGELREPMAMLVALASAAIVGICAAIAAGVVAGQRQRAKGAN